MSGPAAARGPYYYGDLNKGQQVPGVHRRHSTNRRDEDASNQALENCRPRRRTNTYEGARRNIAVDVPVRNGNSDGESDLDFDLVKNNDREIIKCDQNEVMFNAQGHGFRLDLGDDLSNKRAGRIVSVFAVDDSIPRGDVDDGSGDVKKPHDLMKEDQHITADNDELDVLKKGKFVDAFEKDDCLPEVDGFFASFEDNGINSPLLSTAIYQQRHCPVALADRSKAYLGKNLDLEDEIDFNVRTRKKHQNHHRDSVTYDEPRVSSYSTAGTFPMPDRSARNGDFIIGNGPNNTTSDGELPCRWYDEPDPGNVGVTRSGSWYLCCPGGGNGNGAGGNGVRDVHAGVLQPPPVTSPPQPGEGQYLHLAAVSSLKNEVLELSARLHAAQRDRDSARDALCTAQNECSRLRSCLASQGRASEERLTELHGVIAELRRAGAARDRSAIPELREDESELETSCRENSVTGGAGSEQTTSPGDADETASLQDHQDMELQSPSSPAALPIPGGGEFLPRRHEGRSLASADSPRVHRATNNTNCANNNFDSTSLEDDTLEIDRRGYSSGRRRRRASPRASCEGDVTAASADDEACDGATHHSQNRVRSVHRSPRTRGVVGSGAMIGSSSPQSKMASRVRLRRTHEDARLTGKDICQEGVFSSAVAEHLSLRGALGSRQEDGDGDTAERLAATIDRLEADNTLLSATLRESKEHADRLSLACAQCSAEAGALRVALAATDRAVEAYDVLLALAETSTHQQESSASHSAKLRNASERVARQLLGRLECEASGPLRPGAQAGPGPWADVMLYHTANSGNSAVGGWTADEEERLRGHVSRLKRERTIAASGAHPAPWPLQEEDCGEDGGLSRNCYDRPKCLDPVDARRLDMETAVLMQEVMSLREERAELRARLRAIRPPGSRQTNSSSGGEEGESERRLLEALARENTLKTRLQRLMASVHQAGRGNENADDMRRSCPRCGPHNRNTPPLAIEKEVSASQDSNPNLNVSQTSAKNDSTGDRSLSNAN